MLLLPAAQWRGSGAATQSGSRCDAQTTQTRHLNTHKRHTHTTIAAPNGTTTTTTTGAATQVHHRLYVCSTAQPGRMIRSPSMKTTVVNVTPGSERLAASGLKVTHVVSQSDVVKHLYDNRSVFGAALKSTIEQLEMVRACRGGATGWQRCAALCYVVSAACLGAAGALLLALGCLGVCARARLAASTAC